MTFSFVLCLSIIVIILKSRVNAVNESFSLTSKNSKNNNNNTFKYLKNPGWSICDNTSSSSSIDLLIYVHSTPSNLKNRLLIRETWAKRGLFPQTRLVFMLGSTSNKTIQHKLELEYQIYNDIVQQNFDDSYRNLTLKCIMALEWVSNYCPSAKYVLKTDDDVIVRWNFFFLNIIRVSYLKILLR